jgi:hypothetical protein
MVHRADCLRLEWRHNQSGSALTTMTTLHFTETISAFLFVFLVSFFIFGSTFHCTSLHGHHWPMYGSNLLADSLRLQEALESLISRALTISSAQAISVWLSLVGFFTASFQNQPTYFHMKMTNSTMTLSHQLVLARKSVYPLLSTSTMSESPKSTWSWAHIPPKKDWSPLQIQVQQCACTVMSMFAQPLHAFQPSPPYPDNMLGKHMHHHFVTMLCWEGPPECDVLQLRKCDILGRKYVWPIGLKFCRHFFALLFCFKMHCCSVLRYT